MTRGLLHGVTAGRQRPDFAHHEFVLRAFAWRMRYALSSSRFRRNDSLLPARFMKY